MSGTSDKAAGLGNEAMGNIKQGVGKMVGSDKLQGEGLAQEAKGDAQKAVGTAKDGVKNIADKVSDAADRKL